MIKMRSNKTLYILLALFLIIPHASAFLITNSYPYANDSYPYINTSATVVSPFQVATTAHYTLTETANPINGGAVGCSNCSGGGVPEGCTECTFSVSVPAGTVVNLYNAPNSGYVYTGWTGTGTGSYTGTSTGAVTITMDGNITEIGDFASTSTPTYYNLTVYANPSNGGAVNICSYNGCSAPYLKGTTVTISETPVAGYTFTGWSCTGTGCYSGTSTSATVTVNSAMTETANFLQNSTGSGSAGGAASTETQTPIGSTSAGSQNPTAVPTSYCTLNLTSNPTTGGIVTGTGASPGASTGVKTSCGSLVSISATPNANYSFSDWTCSGTGCYSGTSASETFIINSSITEQANFATSGIISSISTTITNILSQLLHAI